MADVKISQLPVATTPVDGTEVLPIVQSATTKQVSIANLTAGRAMSASSLTLSTPLAVTSGGTGLASGTSGGIPYFSSTTAITSSAALAANQLVIGGGAGVAPSTTTTGTGILTFLGAPSSANLAAAVTDETGTGALVFGTSPTFTTSALFPAGTVSAPGIAASGDTDTGIYFPATNQVALATNGAAALSVDSSQNVSVTGTLAMGSSFLRNRIINGAMVIDQRNAGAAVTINATGNTFTLDRWSGFGQATDGVFTVQQSSTAPADFTNSALITVTTADASIGSTQRYGFRQPIEGLNVSDLNWGSASAKTITISFYARSSVTGTFSGVVKNSAGNRSYPFTYAISSANIWEYKTVTIPGDTSGTWLTTNGVGVILGFDVGSGADFKGSANTWAAANYDGATGAVTLISTLNATWYVTGVQLEVGSVATPFERRLYGHELALCQRYFTSTTPVGTAAITATGGFWTMIETSELNRVLAPFMFPVQMRATPTMTAFSPNNAATGNWYNRSTGLNVTVSSFGANSFGVIFNTLTNNQTAGNQILVGYTASAEL